MTQITITQIEGQLVVDSRIIAEQLGNDHHNVMAMIYKFQTKLENKFGTILFETEVASRANPNPVKYALLTEDQILAILSLSRNTDRVVDLKFELVEKFSAQKKLLEDSIDKELRQVIKKRQPQQQLASWEDVREFQTISESQIFTMFCNGRGYPVTLVHDYITTRITGKTAKELREVDWCTGKSSVGLNHICSIEQLQLVSRAKYHFTAIKLIKKETWELRADRAIAKALKEKK